MNGSVLEYVLGYGDKTPLIASATSGTLVCANSARIPLGVVVTLANVTAATLITVAWRFQESIAADVMVSYLHHFSWGPFVVVLPPGKKLYAWAQGVSLNAVAMTAPLRVER